MVKHMVKFSFKYSLIILLCFFIPNLVFVQALSYEELKFYSKTQEQGRVLGALTSAPTVNWTSKSAARINWVNTSLDSPVFYGRTQVLGSMSFAYMHTGQMITEHAATISGMAPDTDYYYCVQPDINDLTFSTCLGTIYKLRSLPGPSQAEMPQLPRSTVDTSMPSVNGQTFNVSADCSNLQTQINAAAAASGNSTHQVVIPAGTVCRGTYVMPVKAAGSGWVIVRTSTPDSQLPGPNTRITPAQKSLMATIMGTGMSSYVNRTVGSTCSLTGSRDYPYNFNYNEYFSNPSVFPLHKCVNNVWQRVTPVAAQNGSPLVNRPTCNVGDWYYQKDGKIDGNFYMGGWWCVEANTWANFTLGTNGQFEGAPRIPTLYFAQGAHHYRLVGLEITVTPTLPGEPFTLYPIIIDSRFASNHHLILDHNYVHGNDYPSRTWIGVELSGSNVAVINSYLDSLNYWNDTGGVDDQSIAINMQNGPGPVKIFNNFISCIGICVFAPDDGVIGMDNTSDVEMRNNYFYKNTTKFRKNPLNPGSDGHYYYNRHSFELKRGRRWLVDGNVFDGNFAVNQQGAMIAITSRPTGVAMLSNNDVQTGDITITNNIIRNSANGIGLTGQGENPTLAQPKTMQRIRIHNNLFENIDTRLIASPGLWSQEYGAGGAPFGFFLNGEDVIVTNNTIKNNGPILFQNQTNKTINPGANLVMNSNIAYFNSGGITNQSAAFGTAALNALWQHVPEPAWMLKGDVFIGPSNQYGLNTKSVYPSDVLWVEDPSTIGFTNPGAGDYSLSALSPAKGKGADINGNLDGSDPGVNMSLLGAATANTISGGGVVYNPIVLPPTPSPTPTPTPTDTTAPVISAITSSSLGQTTATITWTTGESSDTQVDFGPTTSYGFSSTLNTTLGLSHTVSLINLTTGITYNYRVKSRDAAGNLAISANSTFTTQAGSVITPTPTPVPTPAPAGASSAWYGSSWLYRKKITIDKTKVTGALTNFPVLVSITSTDLTKTGKTDGTDMVFTDGSQQKLNYEIESFDKTTGKLIAWVNVSSLSITTNTDIYLYYGNSSASDQQNKTAVWDSSYKGVWHMKETSLVSGGMLADSTSAVRNMTLSSTGGTAASMAGQVGQGVNLTGGTQYGGYYAATSQVSGMGTANTTLEGWVNINSFLNSDANETGLFGLPQGSYPYHYNTLKINSTGSFKARLGGEGEYSSNTSAVPAGQWNHVAAVYDHTNLKIYLNGTEAVTSPLNRSLVDDVFYLNCIERCSDARYDELRVSSVARSADWVKTQYNNQSSPGTFLTVSSQEIYVAPVVPTPTPSPTPAPTPSPASPTAIPSGTGSVTGGSGGNSTPPVVGGIIPGSTPVTPTTPGSPAPSTPSLRLINDKGTFYLIKSGQRQGVTNPGMLFSYGFTFTDAKPASSQDQALPQGSLLLPASGALVKSKEDQTVYLVTNGQRKGFTSEKVFTDLGFKFSSVLIVTNPELQALPKAENLDKGQAAHAPGLDINLKGTIYYIGSDNKLHGFPSQSIYNSWRLDNDYSRVVPANTADSSYPVGSDVIMRVVE